jgi:hypothetical protein
MLQALRVRGALKTPAWAEFFNANLQTVRGGRQGLVNPNEPEHCQGIGVN